MKQVGLEQRNNAARTGYSRAAGLLLLAALLALNNGCSVKKFVINKAGNALAGGGTTFAGDDDPELIKDAAPFSLKLMETLLAESPRHRGLLESTASGFTQYAYAFVQMEADKVESTDLDAATRLRGRARKLYLRARNYGLRGLDTAIPGFEPQLRAQPKAALQAATKKEVPLLYWTAAAWGAAISLSKDNPEMVADVPLMEALIDRAAELDPDYNQGAIHSFLIHYELARAGAPGDPVERSRRHFEQAMKLSQGRQAGPLVTYAEAVCVQQQDLAQFESLLNQALAINVDAQPENRLMNVVMQDRARWLLSRKDELFLIPEK